jgi:hypothetical protein
MIMLIAEHIAHLRGQLAQQLRSDVMVGHVGGGQLSGPGESRDARW